MTSLDSSVDRASVFETESVGSIPTQGIKNCSKCKQNKNISEFAIKDKKKGKIQSYCRSCQSEMSKNHYRSNKNSYLDRNQRRMTEVMKFVDDFKSRPCADCGNSYHPQAMDLHHENGIKEEIVSKLRRKTTLPKVKREIEKCVVLCAVCHRLRHI